MKKITLLAAILTIICSGVGFAQAQEALVDSMAPELKAVDAYTITGEKNFITDYEPLHPDGDVTVIIEIPTGTVAKWEVTRAGDAIQWEFKKGKPRIVQYIGYPGNYGTIPKTLLPKEFGGDGDPLDIIVLGPSVARGTVVKAKLIGVLRLLDEGEQDDKLLAVLAKSPLYEASSIEELDAKFPGVSTIVETWFVSYKGAGVIESDGYANKKAAQLLLDASVRAFGEFTIAP